MMVTMVDASDTDPFRACESVRHRWPHLQEGAAMLERAMTDFVVRKNINIPFYNRSAGRNVANLVS